ncbi:MAG: transposase, partial [Arenimonas sp.]
FTGVMNASSAEGSRLFDRACVLTLFTLFRRPVFRDVRAARAVAMQQSRTLPHDRAACLAWVLMPDYWQGLLVYAQDQSLPALVGRFKAIITRVVDPRHRINGWLWCRGHREATLAGHESLGDAARLLVSAPRRAGLVASEADYPYWESAWDPAPANATTDG